MLGTSREISTCALAHIAVSLTLGTSRESETCASKAKILLCLRFRCTHNEAIDTPKSSWQAPIWVQTIVAFVSAVVDYMEVTI